MITSIIEILELLNMTTSTMLFESRDKILLVTSWAEIMTLFKLYFNFIFSEYLYFKKA